MIGHPRAVAAVVTGECAKLLTEYLTILDARPRWPDVWVEVHNPSPDGSQEMFRTRFPDVHLVTLTCNTAGAVGFSADLPWPTDDDATTPVTGLADFLASANACGSGLGLVASSGVWIDGRDQSRHIPRDPARASKAHPRAARAAGGRPMPQASFVSLLIEAGAIREFGLPTAAFFIWNDHFEFTPRIPRYRKGVHAPHAIVSHLTTEPSIKLEAPGELSHHGVHDKMRDLGAGDAVAPGEAGMRFGSAQRNWELLFRHSHHKAVMRDGLNKGPGAELRTRPRPTREVLAEAGCELAPQR